MLQLIDIKKDYKTVGQTVHALKGVTLRFRKNEFVSILGASGCGKTTMLNIIGGLDHYTSGDLIINGKSTKKYKDRDWDVYRNHRIGFVFQSYNLIPHQTVLGNVEIALTIAGVSKAERKRRAVEALKRVGLGKELRKRPNQLSGGQMQRVAIARALVNNPEILLADEPTGALDTETSVQIMDLIREIAGERLVIMVTHNPDLAAEYSSRIVRLQDGLVLSDSNPYDGKEEEKEAPTSATKDDLAEKERRQGYVEAIEKTLEESAKAGEKTTNEKLEKAVNAKKSRKKEKKAKTKKERSSMSYGTSLGLSARNLAMKKGRTAITSVAGSIGVISVCLVLALSNGFNGYILKTQEDMLSSQPLKIMDTTMDPTAIMSGMNAANDMPDLSQIGDQVYVNSFLTNMAQGMTVTNDLSPAYIEYVESMDEKWYEAIAYDSGMRLNDSLYTEVVLADSVQPVTMSIAALKKHYTDKLASIDGTYGELAGMVDLLGSIYGTMPGTEDVNGEKFGKYVLSQYDVVEGSFPQAANESVLVVGANNDLTDVMLVQLGMIEEADFMALFDKEKKDAENIPFEKIIGKEFKLYDNSVIYKALPAGSEYLYQKVDGKAPVTAEGTTVKISGILRLKEGMNYGCLGNSGLFFTEQLYAEHRAKNMQSSIAIDLAARMEKANAVFAITQAMMAPGLSSEVQATLGAQLMQLVAQNKQYFETKVEASMDYYYISGSSFFPEGSALGDSLKDCYFISEDTPLRQIGGIDTPSSIAIYTDSFDSKEMILEHLDTWNETHDSEEQVKYTDTIGMMMSMVEMMLNAVTYVLVAFTAISLVVSSVMIGIITYVSVVERVKEIGVLRSLGARKKDIKNLFNAETFIIGLSSGVFGVVVTYLLSIGINGLLGKLTGIATLAALPLSSAIIMVVISIALTLISGLIPARAAAKKDPVIALRTE